VYTRPGCHLCERVKQVLDRVRGQVPFALESVDISSDAALTQRYGHDIPVILLDGREIARHFLREQHLLKLLQQPSQEESHE